MSNPPALVDARLHVDERVATLTLDRDDVRNALTGTHLIDDIVDTVQWADGEEAVSVLVITGGGSAFSSGGNIKDLRDRSDDFAGDVYAIQGHYRRGLQRIPLAMHAAGIPVIAAVNGPAIGAGCDLACMCDLRLGSEKALFGETFVNLGLIPGDGGAWFLQRLIGYQRAAELSFTGRVVKAREAMDIGLLLEVTGADALLPRAAELAREIAAKPPQALRLTKRLLKLAQRQELGDFLDLCATFQGMCHNTEDHLEAINAFVEKRPGSYVGR
jgi:enoyl-CoA hydratase/carnithine racemase